MRVPIVIAPAGVDLWDEGGKNYKLRLRMESLLRDLLRRRTEDIDDASSLILPHGWEITVIDL